MVVDINMKPFRLKGIGQHIFDVEMRVQVPQGLLFVRLLQVKE